MNLLPSAKHALAVTAILAGIATIANGAGYPAASAATPVPAASSTPAAAPAVLKVGDTAPVGKGVDQNNKTVDLAEVYKKGIVLVYFYPAAGTPGCTAEACSLRDAYATLTAANLIVVGVSHDTIEAQKEFADDYKLPFSLISDKAGDIYKAFLVPGKNNRQSFIVKDGKIVWLELKASTDKQADDVKKALVDLKVMNASDLTPKPLGTVMPPAATPAAAPATPKST